MRIESFKKLMEEIRPFIKERKYIQYSTAGKWTTSESLMEEEDGNYESVVNLQRLRL
jgi:hypothetical protein